MARKYRIVHESYLAEWLGITYPPGTWRTNVRLGRVKVPEAEKLSPQERRLLLGAFGASADAIVLLPDKVVIVEAMVRHEPGAGEDLLKYKMLFRETEEFKEHWNKPIELILLTPLDVSVYERFYREMGIKVVNYRPKWILEYLSTYPPRFRRGKLSGLE
ncbi:MAG: hypothetical protein ACXQTR_00945 [Candidatus Methanospirareceae archaeon]